MRILTFVAPALLVALLSACGDSGGGGGTFTDVTGADADATAASDATTTSDTATGTGTGASDTVTATDTATGTDTTGTGACDENGWPVRGAEQALVFSDDGTNPAALYYELYDTTDESAPYSLVSVELYYDFGAETGAQNITFTGENYADCGYCLLIYADCAADGSSCDKTYLAQSGTLDITANGGMTGNFAGSLSDVTLTEVTVDDEDFTSTPVAGGKTWCLPSLSFDQTIEPGE